MKAVIRSATLTVAVTPEVKEVITELGQRFDMTPSTVVNDILELHLDDYIESKSIPKKKHQQ